MITVRMDPEHHKALKSAAHREERSLQDFCLRALLRAAGVDLRMIEDKAIAIRIAAASKPGKFSREPQDAS
jgi:hypothetical protein